MIMSNESNGYTFLSELLNRSEITGEYRFLI
jgi:hypothetical protein